MEIDGLCEEMAIDAVQSCLEMGSAIKDPLQRRIMIRRLALTFEAKIGRGPSRHCAECGEEI